MIIMKIKLVKEGKQTKMKSCHLMRFKRQDVTDMEIHVLRPDNTKCPKCQKDTVYFELRDEQVVGVSCDSCGYIKYDDEKNYKKQTPFNPPKFPINSKYLKRDMKGWRMSWLKEAERLEVSDYESYEDRHDRSIRIKTIREMLDG